MELKNISIEFQLGNTVSIRKQRCEKPFCTHKHINIGLVHNFFNRSGLFVDIYEWIKKIADTSILLFWITKYVMSLLTITYGGKTLEAHIPTPSSIPQRPTMQL